MTSKFKVCLFFWSNLCAMQIVLTSKGCISVIWSCMDMTLQPRRDQWDQCNLYMVKIWPWYNFTRQRFNCLKFGYLACLVYQLSWFVCAVKCTNLQGLQLGCTDRKSLPCKDINDIFLAPKFKQQNYMVSWAMPSAETVFWRGWAIGNQESRRKKF